MVAPFGSQYAIYLAASCINTNGASTGYYIFNSQAFTTPPVNTQWTWSNWAGPFTYQNVPLGTIAQNENQPVNSLNEFDWAVRADGTMVAVVTPMYVYWPPSYTYGQNFQYGCLAINFYLTNPTAPFGTVVATLNDTDQGSPYDELYGSNGCTYEPMSNTGVLIGRRLVNVTYDSNGLTPSDSETYGLMNTGVLP